MNALRGVLVLAFLVVCHSADAFGPRTHLWMGDQILGDLRDHCSIELVSRTYRITPDLCDAITSNPESFYAGVLGPQDTWYTPRVTSLGTAM